MAWCKTVCLFTLLAFSMIVFWEVSMVTSATSAPEVGGTNLRVIIPAGTEQCFYQELKGQDNAWIDYSVVGSTQGSGMNIDFQVSDPDSRPLVTEFNKALSNTQISVNIPGVYKFCFDNSQSRFNQKTVAFQLTTRNASLANWEKYNTKDLEVEGEYDLKVNDIKARMDLVRSYINEIQIHQDNFRVAESRDRSIGEANFERVNFWSALFIAATLVVLGVQTFTVRMFFEDKNHIVRKMFRDVRRGVGVTK